MNTRPLSSSALLTVAFGCLMLASSCATPTSTPQTGNCATGQVDCSGQCKTVATDNQNCGACGNACGANRVCQGGMCQCAAGLMNCGGQCVGSDATHCGPSCTVCPSGQVCSGNACMAMCPTGQTMCSGGACIPSTGDGTIAHCGGCNQCPTGATACNNGTCGCAGATDMLCGTSCVNTNNSQSHCGGCNRPCTGTCTNGSCVATTGAGGTTGAAGSTGAGGSVTGTGGVSGTTGSAGRGGTTGTAGVSGATGTAGRGGTTGTGGATGTGGNPPGWWTSGTMHGCPWTGIDTVSGTTTANTPQAFTTKNDSFTTPYCVSGTVHQAYESVALLGFNMNETPTGAADQCGYKPANGTAIGPPAIAVPSGATGMAISFSKSVGSVLRIQLQDEMGGLTTGGDTHRWCYTITDVQGPVFVPFSRFNTKCWDQTGTNFNPATDRISAVVFAVPGVLVPSRYGYCIGGFAFGSSVSAAPAYSSTYPGVMGTIGGPGSTDLDYQRVKVAAPGAGGKQYIIQNNNWGNASGSNQTITYSGNSFTITGESGGSPGNGVPASYPSIYIGNNGDTQNKNDPPKGSYTTKPGDGLPKQISAIGTLNSTAAYNRASGDYNAAYDIWVSSAAPTSDYNDALSGFVMLWMYKPSGRNPIGSMMTTKMIGDAMYQVWVGPRNSGTNPNRPVVSYVATSTTMNKTYNLKLFLADAANYGIPSNWYLTDVFFGFEIWSGSGTSGLSVTNFTADVQ